MGMGFQPRKNAPSRGDLQKNHTAIALTLLPSARRTCHFKRDCGAPTSSASLPLSKNSAALPPNVPGAYGQDAARFCRSLRYSSLFNCPPLKPGNLAHHRGGLILIWPIRMPELRNFRTIAANLRILRHSKTIKLECDNIKTVLLIGLCCDFGLKSRIFRNLLQKIESIMKFQLR